MKLLSTFTVFLTCLLTLTVAVPIPTDIVIPEHFDLKLFKELGSYFVAERGRNISGPKDYRVLDQDGFSVRNPRVSRDLQRNSAV
jgi:hypothetical protein